MPDDTTRCPECGHLSADPEWCDNCGANLKGAESIDQEFKWLKVGLPLKLEIEGVDTTLEVEEIVENFATRKVFTARVTAPDDSPYAEQLLFVEESEDDGRSEGVIPDSVGELFRRPFYVGSNGDHVLEIYQDVGGMTCEDLVDLANNQLSYSQIKDIFEAVANSVMECHSNDQMLLAVAPWTVRIDGVVSAFDGGPDTQPDIATLMFGGSLAGAGATTSEADETAEEPVKAQAESPQEERVVDGDKTMVDGLFNLEGDDESGDASSDEVDVEDDPKSIAEIEDVLDAADEDGMEWDIFEDSNNENPTDAFEDTSILAAKALEANVVLKATFEGLDRTYAVGENPEEVPVIMGFSAPELLGRVRADVSVGCDVFGLGMLLYFLVSGRVPPSSVYTRYAPALPVRNFRPGFPPGLQPVISRATRPNPSDRYPSVQAMMDAFFNACALMEQRAAHVGTELAPRFRMAVDTHVGVAKGRRNPVNQDAVFGRSSDDGRFALVVVADGVSTASYGSGDLASHYLTARASDAWDEILPAYLMDERIDEISIIQDILNKANRDIVDHVNENHTPFSGNPHEVMGTTSLVAVIHNGIITLAALGDSRCYIQNAAGMEQVTIDHNLWSLSVLDGIPADSALAMPHGDALAKCLGTFSISEGRLTAINPDPDYFRFSLTRGDNVLLTSDGLIDFAGPNPYASEENVLAVMLSEPDPALACLELILLANRGGGGDNIGMAIAQFF